MVSKKRYQLELLRKSKIVLRLQPELNPECPKTPEWSLKTGLIAEGIKMKPAEPKLSPREHCKKPNCHQKGPCPAMEGGRQHEFYTAFGDPRATRYHF